MTLNGLAEKINEHTGMEGKELETFTFLCAAVFADAMGHKNIGDYFAGRMNESAKTAFPPEASL
jgi:hypothetical protein